MPQAGRCRIASLLLGLLLSGCAAATILSPAPPSAELPLLAYQPPRPPAYRLDAFAAPVSAALPAALAHLADAGFRIEEPRTPDGAPGIVYRGPPEPHVDCGRMRIQAADGVRELPAAIGLLKVVPPLEEGTGILRTLRLEARVELRTPPGAPAGTLVARGHYRLDEFLDRIDSGGRVLASRQRTVEFETGGTGAFDDRVRCVATGELENRVIRALSGAGAGATPAA